VDEQLKITVEQRRMMDAYRMRQQAIRLIDRIQKDSLTLSLTPGVKAQIRNLKKAIGDFGTPGRPGAFEPKTFREEE
jgi:hypothetical protein